MSSRIRAHIRTNIYGILALFLVLTGGTAMATHPGGANSISSGDIINGEVKEPDVGQGAVASPEVKDDSIVAGDVAPNSLGSNRVADASLTGTDVKNETLTGLDVASLTGADLAPNSIPTGRITDGSLTGVDVADNALKGADIDESTLTNIGGGGPAGGDLTGTYPNPEIAAGAVGTSEVADDSLTGADLDESTLGQVPSALLGGFGRGGATTACNPESATFVFCAGTEILTVPPRARALVFGRTWAITEDGADEGFGLCRLSASSIGTVPNTLQFFEVDNELGDADNATLVGVTPPLPPGATSFGIECQEDFGGIFYDRISASAVLISDD